MMLLRLCFVLLATVVLAESSTNIPASELSALEEFYDALDGPNWVWSTNTTFWGVPWNFTGNPAPCISNDTFWWQGLLCSYDSYEDVFHVRTIFLPYFNLKGKLPSSITQFSNMSTLSLTGNYISGTILPELSSMGMLEIIDFEDNELTGTIPESLTALPYLEVMRMEGNSLEGPLPEWLSEITTLRDVDLAGNHFTGSLPAAWASLVHCQILDLAMNELSGTIPASLGQLAALVQLDLSNNELTGTIPSELTALQLLRAFFISENYLTGSLPESLGQMTNTLFLDVGENYLMGSIPASIGDLPNLLYIHGHDNLFSGSLPSSIGNIPYLVQIYLYNNLMTGSLPKSLAKLSMLEELQIYNNKHTGSLTQVFNATLQKGLTTIQLERNRFTGSIPSEPFKVAGLRSVTLGTNCLRGQFPLEVCSATKLRNLQMDGMHAARACQTPIFPGITHAYTIMATIFGTVPSCYFALPSLLSLHLSGNELSGTLPANLVVGPEMVDMSLSHNGFTGPIPRAIQARAWLILDLANNRFDGTLDKPFGEPFHSSRFGLVSYTNPNTSSTLNLENNRLSGRIPKVLIDMKNISLLKENIFSCASDKSDLPRQDDAYESYYCGSTDFDTPYYVYISLVCTVLVGLLTTALYHEKIKPYYDVEALARQLKRYVNIGYSAEYQVRLKTYNHVCDICQIICRTSFTVAAGCVFVLVPIYVALSYTYTTHTHQYAWVVSALFLQGPVAFGILFCTYVVLVCLLLGYFARSLRYTHRDWRSVLSRRQEEELHVSAERKLLPKAGLWDRVTTYTPMILANFTVVLSANFVFVYVIIYGSARSLMLAEVILPMFKLFWNKVGSRLISRYTAHEMNKKALRFARSEFFAILLFIALVNNIGIPCLVIIFTSPSCIYNMFVPVEPARAHFASTECDESTGFTCSQYETIVHTSEYDPPYIYSYQCSASFIMYYAAAFVNMCIFSGFGTPLVQFSCRPLYPHTTKGSWTRFFLKRLVPKLLRPVPENVAPGSRQMDPFRPFFDANQLLLSLFTNLAVMLTFGVIFPPLAVGMAFTILSIFYFARVKVGIFITGAAAANSPGLVEIVDRECQGAGYMPVLHRSVWTLVGAAFVFYTWFLFDTLGNTEGLYGAYWVFILVPLMPFVILPIHIRLRRDAYAHGHKPDTSDRESSFAMPGKAIGNIAAGFGVDVEMATFSKEGGEEVGVAAVNVMHTTAEQSDAN